jgi:hypothetical protein
MTLSIVRVLKNLTACSQMGLLDIKGVLLIL